MSGLEITLLRPVWLLALLPLLVFARWAWLGRSGAGDWHKAADPALMQAMTALGRIDPRNNRGPLIATLSIIALTLVAIAGPAVERRDTLSYRNLDGVLFLIDASPSVTDDPGWTQFLTMGRLGLSALGTRPGGLIVYSGDAYVATDMTNDHLQLGQTLSLIDADTVPDQGSRPERALKMAADILQQADVIAGDVVMFTDGAGFGAASLRHAARIAELGARLSIVSLHEPAPDMHTHVAAGDGAVFTSDQSEAFSNLLREDVRTRLEAQNYPLLYWKDLGRYLLAFALIPMLLMFRRAAT